MSVEQAVGRMWGVSREACRQVGLPLLAPLAVAVGLVVAASPLRDALALLWIPAVVGGGWLVMRFARSGRGGWVIEGVRGAIRYGSAVAPRDFRLAAKVILTWDQVMVRSGGALRIEHRVPDATARSSTAVRREVVERAPALTSLRSEARGLVAQLRVPPGLSPDLYSATDVYASSWGVPSASSAMVAPGVVEVCLESGGDPLAEPVRWSQVPPARPDLRGSLPVALSDAGAVVALQQAHVLVLGATGSGKGSAIWAAVRAVVPAAECGLVRLVGLDSKASEVRQAEQIFCDYGYSAEDHARVFADLAALVARRGEQHTGREFAPTSDDPLVVVVIDEITSLTSIFKDAKERNAAIADLRVVLSLGRSRGILVVAAGQDPTKESMPLRNLFPQVVALRLRDATETRVALGEAAESAGAEPHRIPVASRANDYAGAGIGFVQDETGELARVRFPYMSDDDLAALVGLLGQHAGHGCPSDPIRGGGAA